MSEFRLMLNKAHFLLPLAPLLCGISLEYSGLDMVLIRPFYDGSLHQWTYRRHWLASGILHTGGRNLVVAAAAAIFVFFILSFLIKKFQPCRKGTAYLLAASLSGPAVVSLCKHTTHIYSPWDLKLFDGIQPYIRLFDAVPKGAEIGQAFPAGHSSGGFAFFSLYFLALAYHPSVRYAALFLALLLGFSFGIAQQARGAHFLSHDFFSLTICWYCALFTYVGFFQGRSSNRGSGCGRRGVSARGEGKCGPKKQLKMASNLSRSFC